MNQAIVDAIAVLQQAFSPETRRPPLGWQTLRSWEQQQRILLPEPYRSFVAEVANGTNDGPPHESGLLPVGEKPAGWAAWEPEDWRSPEPFDGTAAREIARPFPLDDDWVWEYDYYDDALHSRLIHQAYQCGSVLLGCAETGPYGTGSFWTLVVAGPQRGQVWELTDAGAGPYARKRQYARILGRPVASFPTEGGFLDWVRDWQTGQGRWRVE